MSNTPSVFISKQKTNDLMQNALLSGGAKKASKKASKKKSKKVSKKPQKGGTHDMNLDMQVLLGRSKNHKKTASKKSGSKKSGSKKSGSKKAKSKKSSSKKLSRGLPEAIIQFNKFKKYIQDDLKISGGRGVMMIGGHYWRKAKENNPTATPDKLFEESKQLYLTDKKNGNLEKIIEQTKK